MSKIFKFVATSVIVLATSYLRRKYGWPPAIILVLCGVLAYSAGLLDSAEIL